MIELPTRKIKQGKSSKKFRRQASNKRRNKYRKAFISCVKRTGKWRGKKKTLADAY